MFDFRYYTKYLKVIKKLFTNIQGTYISSKIQSYLRYSKKNVFQLKVYVTFQRFSYRISVQTLFNMLILKLVKFHTVYKSSEGKIKNVAQIKNIIYLC